MKTYTGNGANTKIEPPQKKLFYNYASAQAAVTALGMCWDSVGIDQVDDDLFRLGLTELQANHVIVLHAQQVKRAFSPKTYTFKGRIFLAAMFLFPWIFAPKALRN